MKVPYSLRPPLILLLAHSAVLIAIWFVQNAQESSDIFDALLYVGVPLLLLSNLLAMLWLKKVKLLVDPLAISYLVLANVLIIGAGFVLFYLYGIAHFQLDWSGYNF